jgi:uncharacterized membrane protein
MYKRDSQTVAYIYCQGSTNITACLENHCMEVCEIDVGLYIGIYVLIIQLCENDTKQRIAALLYFD